MTGYFRNGVFVVVIELVEGFRVNLIVFEDGILGFAFFRDSFWR